MVSDGESRLMRPTAAFPALRDSFLDGLRELRAEGRPLHLRTAEAGLLDARADEIDARFDAFLADLRRRETAGQQPAGLVPESFFWLVDATGFIGRASIRHELNDDLRLVGGHIGYEIRPTRRRQGHGTRILTLALDRARDLGLREVLLTCDADNTGSRRIIEANGGVLENEVPVPNSATRKLRFWIAVPG